MRRGDRSRPDLQPMLASLADAPLADRDLVYEPKYDGIRAIAEIEPPGSVRLWSRLGNDKTGQFPEVARALASWTKRRSTPLVLDGEIVALDEAGQPTGFQQLQGRIHHIDAASPASVGSRVAFILFDLLREGAADLRDRTLVDRRAALERLVRTVPAPLSDIIRLSELVPGDGRALYSLALERGWEGLIAKRADSRYRSGARTPDWRKLKIVHEQEFVVGGWTEPRQARAHLGALLLGVYEPAGGGRALTAAAAPAGARARTRRRSRVSGASRDGGRVSGAAGAGSTDEPALVYVGSVGTGFDARELTRLIARLRPLEIDECPFLVEPRPNERPHWVKPTLVAQVKFIEWTSDAKLRHPVYLGLRDDKSPLEIVREPVGRLHATSNRRLDHEAAKTVPSNQASPDSSAPRARTTSSQSRRGPSPARNTPRRGERAAAARSAGGTIPSRADLASVMAQLNDLEAAGRDGRLDLGRGAGLAVTNLHKVFWPGPGITKGELFRYYVEVAPYLLPAIADRPLVMKRFPNGVTAAPFYQHKVGDVPPGVRVALVATSGDRAAGKPKGDLQLVGGDLLTLLYTTQLAAISQDPWFSRVGSPGAVDYVAFDLDPSPGVTFRTVLDVARWIRDELAAVGATGVPKTSGADGLHVYVPLPPDTSYEAGLLFCEIVATVVAQKHPKQATIERSVRKRGERVYVDFLQNVLGKTLASAYSARATPDAGVSTPLAWTEVDRGVRREDFTIRTMPARLREVGDLWAALRTAPGVDLEAASRRWSG